MVVISQGNVLPRWTSCSMLNKNSIFRTHFRRLAVMTSSNWRQSQSTSAQRIWAWLHKGTRHLYRHYRRRIEILICYASTNRTQIKISSFFYFPVLLWGGWKVLVSLRTQDMNERRVIVPHDILTFLRDRPSVFLQHEKCWIIASSSDSRRSEITVSAVTHLRLISEE